jgi:hypothetical protein
MPEQVVDFLEVIQVDAKNGEGAAGIPGMLHQCGKAGVECGAIGQLGQEIVRRQISDLLLGAVCAR